MAGSAKYRSHAYRRCETQELQETGPAGLALRQSGLERASYQGYAALTPEVEAGARQVFVSAHGEGSSSDDETSAPRTLGYHWNPFGRCAGGPIGIRVSEILPIGIIPGPRLVSFGGVYYYGSSPLS